MKKHLFLLAFLASAAALPAVTLQAQTLTAAPENITRKVRETAQNTFSALDSGNYGKEKHGCKCDKCRKGKKGKGHHKRKNKHHDKHGCCCKHDRRDDDGCGRDDDRRHGRNKCGDDDDRYSDRSNRGDGGGRRYEESSRDQKQAGPGKTRAGQHASKARVKTRPVPTSNRTSTPSGAQKRKVSIPVRTRN